MKRFIDIENYTVATSDIEKLELRGQEGDKCSLVVYLKTAKNPSDNLFIQFEKKEDAEKTRKAIRVELNS